MLTEAYKAEYETTDITIEALMAKYELTKDDIKGHETWEPFIKPTLVTKPTKIVKPKTKKQTIVDKIIANAEVVEPKQDIVTKVEPKQNIPTLPETTATEANLAKIANFKDMALDHCLKFMVKDAQFSEVKEFKDIVAIVDSLEKSYQKVDPDAGKPTINILVQNLMERFTDDC